jgi:hypothetical protein
MNAFLWMPVAKKSDSEIREILRLQFNRAVKSSLDLWCGAQIEAVRSPFNKPVSLQNNIPHFPYLTSEL